MFVSRPCIGGVQSLIVALPGDLLIHCFLFLKRDHSQDLVVSGKLNEPPHEKTNKMAGGPSKDSDQPGSLATH